MPLLQNAKLLPQRQIFHDQIAPRAKKTTKEND
jgi:hypothetical protein